MSRTHIDGRLSPLTFMNNDIPTFLEEAGRDCAMAKEARGLNLTRAGSINDGSLLKSMGEVMHAIQTEGWYQKFHHPVAHYKRSHA